MLGRFVPPAQVEFFVKEGSVLTPIRADLPGYGSLGPLFLAFGLITAEELQAGAGNYATGAGGDITKTAGKRGGQQGERQAGGGAEGDLRQRLFGQTGGLVWQGLAACVPPARASTLASCLSCLCG